jgi:putative DNA primase/helicase
VKTKEELEKALAAAQKDMAWALKSEDARRINAMLDLARSEPGIPILPADLDRNAWLLNCPNGVVDLRTGRLREHRREDYITKICPTGYDPAAKCPAWERFLADIFPATREESEEAHDQELIDFLQRFLGYCLTGDVREQHLVIFWGGGANGKSTLVNAAMGTIGPDYAMKANQELLTVHRGERHSTERMDLFGKRLVVASETSEGAKLNEALVKDLTGGEPIRGRRMHEEQWQFEPTHKLILCTNHKPRIVGSDHAIWRRLLLVPFLVTFWNPDDPAEQEKGLPVHLKQDKELPAKLLAERPGVLAWIVRGCLEWQRQGLRVPHGVTAATKAYRQAEDVLQQFLDERCIVDGRRQGGSNYRCRAGELYAAYKAWCEAGGEEWQKQRTFGGLMTDRGFQRDTSNGVWYLGIALRDGEVDD